MSFKTRHKNISSRLRKSQKIVRDLAVDINHRNNVLRTKLSLPFENQNPFTIRQKKPKPQKANANLILKKLSRSQLAVIVIYRQMAQTEGCNSQLLWRLAFFDHNTCLNNSCNNTCLILFCNTALTE